LHTDRNFDPVPVPFKNKRIIKLDGLRGNPRKADQRSNRV
jgi:hypothetical protein